MRTTERSRYSFEVGDNDSVEVGGGGYDHGHPGDIDVAVAGGELRLSLSRAAAEKLREGLGRFLDR